MWSFSKTTGEASKTREATEHADTFQVHSIKQTVGGKEIFFYDAFANILRVNGQDVLQKYRTNIGQ